MRGKPFRLLLLLVTLLLALGLAGCGGDDDEAEPSDTGAATEEEGDAAAGGTLVFAGAADPVALDGALVSDGESLRVIQQIFETLVALEPGGDRARARSCRELGGERGRHRRGHSRSVRA